MSTRRTFLRTAALASAASSLSFAEPLYGRTAAQAPFVRRNIYSLDPSGPEIATLRAGVKAMKALNPATGLPTNTSSWGYQRAIHKYPLPAPSPLPVAWNTCTHHGSPGPAFLSWHRAYLHYFERICRAVSGDPNFALPYWNYDYTDQDAVPPVFLDADPANPLYHANRDANDGLPIDEVYRGAQGTITIADFGLFHSSIETCHDNTHGAIGGDMGQVRYSPLDPIFYLHHCNLDRCWRHWQLANLGGGDPSPLPSWWTTSWTFFDENGAQVQMTGQQAEHTTNLGYTYDDEPRILVRPEFTNFRPKLVNLCQRFPQLCRPIRLIPRPPWPLPIAGNRPVVLPLRLPPGSAAALADTKKQAGQALSRGLLVLELILDWSEGSPILLAEARPVGDTRWIKAGAVSGFSRGGERDTVQIDVSRVFERMPARAVARDLEWRVRFVSGRTELDGAELVKPQARGRARILAAQLAIPNTGQR